MPAPHHASLECSRRSFLGMSATAAWAVGSAAAVAQASRADDVSIIDCHVHLKHGERVVLDWGVPDWGVPDWGVPDWGVEDWGVEDWGVETDV